MPVAAKTALPLTATDHLFPTAGILAPIRELTPISA